MSERVELTEARAKQLAADAVVVAAGWLLLKPLCGNQRYERRATAAAKRILKMLTHVEQR